MSHHRLVVFGAVFALLVGALAPTTLASGPQTSADSRSFQKLAFSGTSNFTPAALDQKTQVTVIVHLAGKTLADSIGAAKANGRTLSKDQRAAIVANIKSGQASAISHAKGLGATLRETYQTVYNGFSVNIARGQLVALSKVSGVTGIFGVAISTLDNERSVPFIGAPSAWQDFGVTGTGEKIGEIDTGIDYYHANFGGSGNPADFAAGDGLGTDHVFPTTKVAGGWDFVGDAYNANSSATSTPHPDPDPKDCGGHGSHTAGTAAGYGVLSTGATYTGPYNSTTVSSNTWNIGPGVAPEATLYGYRVFGCAGSVQNDIVVAAIDRAVSDGMDVVNMSLGSPFGGAAGPEQDSVTAAAAAGTLIVASAGNSGPNAYIQGSPASADHALSVAAIDGGYASFPGATLSNPAITTINANGATFSNGLTVPIKVLYTGTPHDAAHISLGCDPNEYTAAGVSGKLVVVQRGTCARVARAIFGQEAGAAAVLMVNSSDAYPPYEGQITSNPDTGQQYTVTIPFLGAKSSQAAALVAADTQSTTLNNTTVANPTYKTLASFSSGGPRVGDSAAKPDVAAPGVSTVSTAVGTGTGATTMSGTSMAAPHVTGVAALVMQAHPGWSPDAVKAAIENTASVGSSVFAGTYNPRTLGSGVVQARTAVDTLLYATTGSGLASLSFGNEAIGLSGYSETITVTLHNTDSSSHDYNLSQAAASVQGSTMSFSTTNPVTVPANGTATVDVTLSLTPSAAAALVSESAANNNFGAVNTIRGVVLATPVTSGAGVDTLRIPYLLAPRGLSSVTPAAPGPYTFDGTSATSTRSDTINNTGVHNGSADIYSWGATDPADNSVAGSIDIRNIGVQSLPGAALGGTSSDRSLVFAINVSGQWSNASQNEYDIAIDNNSDGKADYFVIGFDYGQFTAGAFDGRFASIILKINKKGPASFVDAWVATAPMNGSTIELPALASEIGLVQSATTNTKFMYQVTSFEIFDGTGAGVDQTAWANWDSHVPPVTTGDFFSINPGSSANWSMTAMNGRINTTKVLGWLVVTTDDANGTAQADTVALGKLPSPH